MRTEQELLKIKEAFALSTMDMLDEFDKGVKHSQEIVRVR
jgi:hypothetical protein